MSEAQELARDLRNLLHKHANWAHQAINEQDLSDDKKSFIYSPFEISDTVETEHAVLALVQAAEARGAEKIANTIKKQLFDESVTLDDFTWLERDIATLIDTILAAQRERIY